MTGEKDEGLPLDLVSRFRGALYGLSILWVVLFHARVVNKVDFKFGHPGSHALSVFANVIRHGNVGVDVFLLLSGIFLYYSYSKNPDPVTFVKKRAVRIYVPVAVIYTAWWIVKFTIRNGISGMIPRLVLRETLLCFWVNGNGGAWYASLIMALYLAYPYIFAFLYPQGPDTSRATSTRRVAIMVAVTYAAVISCWMTAPERYDMLDVALTRIPIFMFGAYLGKFVKDGARLPKWSVLIAIAGTVAFFWCFKALRLGKCYDRYPYFLGGIFVTWVLAAAFSGLDSLRKGNSLVLRFLSFTGGFSFELYLTHMMLNQVLRSLPIYREGSLAQYAVMAAIAYVLAWAVAKWVSVPASKRLLKRA